MATKNQRLATVIYFKRVCGTIWWRFWKINITPVFCNNMSGQCIDICLHEIFLSLNYRCVIYINGNKKVNCGCFKKTRGPKRYSQIIYVILSANTRSRGEGLARVGKSKPNEPRWTNFFFNWVFLSHYILWGLILLCQLIPKYIHLFGNEF